MEHTDCRTESKKIYEKKKINGIRIKSKYDWYEYGEKSSNFFLNLEIFGVGQTTIRNITKDDKSLYLT